MPHWVVMVCLDLQEDAVVVWQVQVDEQDVHIGDEGIAERLEDALNELAILDTDEVV